MTKSVFNETLIRTEEVDADDARLPTATETSVRLSDGLRVFSCGEDQIYGGIETAFKKVIIGTICSRGDEGRSRPCVAVVFTNSYEKFGIECANLSAMSSIGVGPKLYAIEMTRIAGGAPRPTIFEEYVGRRLDELIHVHGVGSANEPVLHELGTKGRDIENKKILFDVYSQLMNAHEGGLFHRDLTCGNICVRRFGERPEDIKATIIDFELSSNRGGAREKRLTRPIFSLLFERIPSMLADESVSVVPTPMEFDMGYLAAVQYQLQHDALFLGDNVTDAVVRNFNRFLNEEISYFRYDPLRVSQPFVCSLDMHDIVPLAQELGLVEVSESRYPTLFMYNEALSLHRAYLDREDEAMLKESVSAALEEHLGYVVAEKFENYKELRHKQRKDIEYESVDDQPETLQRSNYAQAAHIPVKVRALGYEIVSREEWEQDTDLAGKRIESFTEDQIEFLAEMEHVRWCEERWADGWTLGPHKDVGQKISPYLIPYAELHEDDKEFDRIASRDVIPLLNDIGLVVIRRE